MSFLQIIAAGFLVLGVLTMLVSAFGVVRFPDFYTRLHAAGKGDTLGQGLVLLGLLLIAGFGFDAFKLAVIIFFVMILNATATHGLARAGWLAGMRPWLGGDDPAPQREGQMTLADRAAVIAPVRAAAPPSPAPEVPALSEPEGAGAAAEAPGGEDVDVITLDLEDDDAPGDEAKEGGSA